MGRYSDDFRAKAVALLTANGYPSKKGAMTKTAASLDIPHATLSRWANEVQNPPPPELVREKKVELKELLQIELSKTIEAMDGKRGEALYSSLSWTMAVLTDKLILLDGGDTSRVDNKITITVEYAD